ncbi:DUF695 domain-containing protein [Paractinoplanes hotanensis]|uniref:DUF695 domain-containing protein n=1 Tax=Paractinoplanes hotanensis TaxID=2906497 RepID=A0ABT0YC23_9ACTN|nr:DUF695 domain-containing protein [Actinoplanes hotanensis]MCM4083587.1 DUF695 domain-containing protein [Actinoplanes hotanensis]
MRLFSKKAPPQNETIAEFWQWWNTARDDVAKAVNDGTLVGLGKEIERRVHAVDPGLSWEVRRSSTSAHVLAVTPRYPANVRAAAERWLAAAPPADETWSYRSVLVVADPEALESTREHGGHVVDLAETRYCITVREQDRQIDVVCWHPAFEGLPEDAREHFAYHAIDWALGEDDAVVWTDEITWTAAEPAKSCSPAEFREAVSALAGRADHWKLWSGNWNGSTFRTVVAAPLHPERWPRFDQHVLIRLPYRRFDDEQLPVDESLTALRRFEEKLSEAAGADGALVAHETVDGRRTLHFYVDSQTGALAELESRLPQWREGQASVDTLLDPMFQRVEYLQ